MEERKKVVKAMNVDLTCDLKCEECEKFFQCKNDVKWEILKIGRWSKIRESLAYVRHKIAVAAGKGGVGKSTVSTNLALAFALKKYKVGLIDHDFDGPCIPKMLGIEDKHLTISDRGIEPVIGPYNIKVVSTGLILGESDVLTWFHSMRRNATEEFLCGVNWGELDYLIIDLPPGTSSDTVNLMQCIPDLTGVVIVTIPSEVSQAVARRAIRLVKSGNIRVLGVIENMSGYVCPFCGKEAKILREGGGARLAQVENVPFIGSIPIDPSIAEACDRGMPYVDVFGKSFTAQKIMEIVNKIAEMVGGGVV